MSATSFFSLQSISLRFTRRISPALLIILAIAWSPYFARASSGYDVVVYGSTPAGVMAAVAAASHGHSVVLLSLNNHVGGMVSGGLTYTDMGDRTTVGGLANDFFNDIVSYYTTTYGAGSAQLKASLNGIRFEPHVAELIYDQMLAEQKVTVIKNVHIDLTKPNSVTVNAYGNITSVTVQNLTASGTQTFTGKIYIDASYEGDLMAGSPTTYTYGREAASQYGESLGGIQVPGPDFGQADDLIMSYNYRTNLTTVASNRLRFPKPTHYDPTPFISLYASDLQSGSITQFTQLFFSSGPSYAGPNTDYCSNSFDFAGSSDGYADGDWTTRDQIAQNLKDYEESCFYYLQNETASLSPAFYKDAQNWGLPKDEFTDTGGFPFQLYIREARRMVGQYVLKQSDLTQDRYKTDGVCSGSYGIDCHVIQQLTVDGHTIVDRTPSLSVANYDIPYACLTPSTAPGQPGNLLVPVCCSASHVAYDSTRTEPVYMMLGQAAGDAAHLAILHAVPVQQVNVTDLRSLLQADGAILNSGYLPPFEITFSPAHPKVGETVRFTFGPTSHPLVPFTTYWWDFEGTGGVASQLHSPQYVFTQNKTYTVSLIIQDEAGRRAMVTTQVPVGTAAGQDLTQDDFDPSTTLTGIWDAAYPTLPGNSELVDVFTGAGTHYSAPGHSGAAQARYQPPHLAPGLYQVCFGYRPSTSLADAAVVTISTATESTQVTVNEQTPLTSPFPFVSLGTFRFSGTGKEYVNVSTATLPTQKIATDAIRFVWEGN